VFAGQTNDPSALAGGAKDNGHVSSLVTKIFIWKIIHKYVYWAKPGLGEYEGGSLLGHRAYCIKNRFIMYDI